jgi:hypothetical protein
MKSNNSWKPVIELKDEGRTEPTEIEGRRKQRSRSGSREVILLFRSVTLQL